MSEPEPWPEEESKDGETPIQQEWTPQEADRVFYAQLVLFVIMGIFIITPFILWWWLSTRPK